MPKTKTLLEMNTSEQYEYKRTRVAQRKGHSDPKQKRRVNITITGELWDKLDELGVENKSYIIQEFVKQYIEEHEEKKED